MEDSTVQRVPNRAQPRPVPFRPARAPGRYSDLGPPPIRVVEAFATAAVTKAQTGQAQRMPNDLSVVSTPVRNVRTSLGTVAYRVIGTGPPLLLVTGYGATMEAWDRRFVDALAERYRVVIFDNAGIGRTQALPAPLTVDAMANQTSAPISALRLGHANVLGWSMGSIIAQALATLHPGQVRRLLLCASWPGNGTAVRPSQQAINALNSGNQNQTMATLFPADQAGARNSYLAALSSYPATPPVPNAVITAQATAVEQ